MSTDLQSNEIPQYLFLPKIIMSEQPAIKQSRFLLPPVRLYSRTRTSNHIIKKYLGLVQAKKTQLEQQLKSSQQTLTNLELSYINHQPHSNHNIQQKKSKHTIIEQDQILARGSIESCIDDNASKGRSLHRPLGLSSLSIHDSPYKIIISPSHAKKDSFRKSKGQNRYKQKCQTEPSNDASFNFENNPFVLDNVSEKELQNGSVQLSNKKTKNIRSQIQQIKEPKALSRAGSRQEIKGQEFTLNPLLNQLNHQTIESTNTVQEQPADQKRYQSLGKVDSKNVRYLQSSSKFKQLSEALEDLKSSAKTNERLEKTAKILQQSNPFFKKIQRVIGVCLLRIGKIQQKQAQNYLYHMNNAYPYFYIVLHGKVRLIGKHGMNKICETGQTLLEEVVFDVPKNGKEAVSLEKGKVLENTWLLRVDLKDFQKLERELVKFGFRKGLIELRNIMRRNQIVKNWVRNKSNLLIYQ